MTINVIHNKERVKHMRSTTSLFFIAILIIYQCQFNYAALNIHRNFGEGLIGAIKDHVYIDHAYTIDRHLVAPTCNSLDGTTCYFLKHRYEHNQQNKEVSFNQHDRHSIPDLPILPYKRNINVSSVSPDRPIPIFEAGIGDDSDSESFASVSGDAITWLVSRGSLLNGIWQMKEQSFNDDDIKKQTSVKKHDTLLMSLSKLESKMSTKTTTDGNHNVESGRWYSFRYWLKRLDRFAESIADLILADFDLDEDSTKDEQQEVDTVTEDVDDEQRSHLSHEEDKNQSIDMPWSAVSRIIEFNNVPIDADVIPEFYGTSVSQPFDVGLRWIGDWKHTTEPRQHRREYHDLDTLSQTISIEGSTNSAEDIVSCAELDTVAGSIIFSKPVLPSRIFLRKTKPSFEEKSEVPIESSVDSEVPPDARSAKIESAKGGIDFIPIGAEVKPTQQIRVEGWFWDRTARKAFQQYLEEQGEENGSNKWFYSSFPNTELKNQHVTRVWTVVIDLQSNSSDTDISLKSFLWNRNSNYESNEINVIDRISGSPYTRVDGISIRYGVEKLARRSTVSPVEASDSIPNVLDKILDPSPAINRGSKTEYFIPLSKFPGHRSTHSVTQNSRLSGAPGISICQLLLHRPVLTSSHAGGHRSDLEYAAVRPGVIIREMFFDPSVTSESVSTSLQQLKNPKLLELHDRERYISSIREEQQKRYLTSEARNQLTQVSTPSPPFGHPVTPRVLQVPDIANDGVLLAQDWRPSMKRIEIILQRFLPIEAPVLSLSNLHTLNKLLIHKVRIISFIFSFLKIFINDSKTLVVNFLFSFLCVCVHCSRQQLPLFHYRYRILNILGQ